MVKTKTLTPGSKADVLDRMSVGDELCLPHKIGYLRASLLRGKTRFQFKRFDMNTANVIIKGDLQKMTYVKRIK